MIRKLVGKPEVGPPLGRPRYRQENDFKVNLEDIYCGSMLDMCDVG